MQVRKATVFQIKIISLLCLLLFGLQKLLIKQELFGKYCRCCKNVFCVPLKLQCISLYFHRMSLREVYFPKIAGCYQGNMIRDFKYRGKGLGYTQIKGCIL